MNDTIVIGAGLAGLSAAKCLVGHGYSVVLIEARDRAGGRVWTQRPGTMEIPIDLGAEWIGAGQLREILERAGLALIETDLIGVELPEGNQPLLQVCTALLQAEVNIVQAYPLLVRPRDRPAVALMVDNIEMGLETLDAKGFTMITENDLAESE